MRQALAQRMKATNAQAASVKATARTQVGALGERALRKARALPASSSTGLFPGIERAKLAGQCVGIAARYSGGLAKAAGGYGLGMGKVAAQRGVQGAARADFDWNKKLARSGFKGRGYVGLGLGLLGAAGGWAIGKATDPYA